jgi:nitrile hydratase accessory protein
LSRPDEFRAATTAVAPIPLDDDGSPVFAQPWEAQAFAMALALHEGGHFTWPEWAAALAQAIAEAQAAGDPDDGSTYYRHWLAAIEQLVERKGVVDPGQLAARREAWDRAAHATPHGRPILLENDPGLDLDG